MTKHQKAWENVGEQIAAKDAEIERLNEQIKTLQNIRSLADPAKTDRIKDLEKALAVFADEQSWIFWRVHRYHDCDPNNDHWAWDKLGDFADPREFARLALEGK